MPLKEFNRDFRQEVAAFAFSRAMESEPLTEGAEYTTLVSKLTGKWIRVKNTRPARAAKIKEKRRGR